jgi:hypothetical protein
MSADGKLSRSAFVKFADIEQAQFAVDEFQHRLMNDFRICVIACDHETRRMIDMAMAFSISMIKIFISHTLSRPLPLSEIVLRTIHYKVAELFSSGARQMQNVHC